MKRFVVLMALLVTAGMLWAQAAPAGPALTLNAVISYMEATDFAAGREFSDKPQFELKFNWVVDEFNTAYLEFEEGTMGVSGGKGFNTSDVADVGYGGTGVVAEIVDKAWFKTDIGKALKVPVGLSLKFGLEEWNNADGIKVTKSEWEDYLGEKDFRTWGAQVEIVPAPVATLRSSWAWNTNALSGAFQNLFLVGAYGTVAPVSYEVTYFTNGSTPAQNPDGEFGKGWIEGGLEFNQDVATGINVAAALNAEYDMGDDTGTVAVPAWRVQVGAQMLYNKMASVGLAWRGQEEATAGGLQIQGWAMPIAGKPLELFVTAGVGLDDALYPETFDSMEASVKYSFGKASYYVGLYYAVLDTGNIAKEWLDMDVAGTGGKGGAASETTALWIRGTLSF